MDLDLRHQLQLFLGIAELETHPWIRRCGKIAQTAIDIGAGDGELVLYFLRRTSATRVYAFEPLERSRKRLEANLILNGVADSSRVVVSGHFVGSKDDLQFIRLDSLISEIRGPLFIKVDVDGAELDVLRGAKTLLSSRPVYWLVETHSSELESACLEVFGAAGYKIQIIENGWYRKLLPENRPIPHNRWFTAEPQCS